MSAPGESATSINDDFANQSNAVLIKQIIDGSQSAEQTLVNRFWRSLYFILTKRCQDPQLAQDLAQDTFIVVLLNIRDGKLQNPEALAKYIRETGCNLMLGHFRKQQRRETDTNSELSFSVPDNSPCLYRVLYSKQGLNLVVQLLGQLEQSRDREVLMGLFLYGKDKQQICQELELSVDNFDKVLHRARFRLKQMAAVKLEQDYSDLTQTMSILLIFMTIGLSPMTLGKYNKKITCCLEGKVQSSHLYSQGVVHNQLHRTVNTEIGR